MTRVLMLPVAYSHGTVGAGVRALAIARALRAAGAEVAFCAAGGQAPALAAEGYSVHTCPVPIASGAAVPIRSQIDALTWTGLADPALCAGLVEAELDAIQAFGPDVLWAEFRPTAAISSAAAGLPLAAIANWPAHPDFPPNRGPDPAAEVFNRLLRRYGQPPVTTCLELVFLRSQLRLAPTLPELEPELAAAERDVVFIGHTVDRTQPDVVPEWFDEGQPEFRGFVYLSVTPLDFATYSAVLRDTFAGLPCRVVCAIGHHATAAVAEASSAEVRFFPYLPALPLIARSQFVMSHAGHDTVLSALYHGVPSLVVPGASSEREYNAQGLIRSGAGIALPYTALRPVRLRPALRALLDGMHREAASRLSRSLRLAGGCEEAARRILSLAARPVAAGGRLG